jgi:hypothetical protein
MQAKKAGEAGLGQHCLPALNRKSLGEGIVYWMEMSIELAQRIQICQFRRSDCKFHW